MARKSGKKDHHEPGPPPDETTADARARDLKKLHAEIALSPRPLTDAILADWVGRDIARQNLLADTIWGTIRWRKSIGRPAGPLLQNGFGIAHEYMAINGIDLGGGNVADTSKWVAQPRPATWDAEDKDHWVVRYFAYAAPALPNAIRVWFAPGIGWSRPHLVRARGYPWLQPAGIGFIPKPGRITVLEDFEVVIKPWG